MQGLFHDIIDQSSSYEGASVVKTIHFKDLLDSNGGLIVLAQEGEK